MLNSGMERTTDIGTLLSRIPSQREEKMFRRFHGIDRHKKYSTLSGNRSRREGDSVSQVVLTGGVPRQSLREGRVSSGGRPPQASCGCFYWADRIEASGATCFVLDPRRFRIITDSWNKTDRQDARNMAKALWVFQVTGEFGIPTGSFFRAGSPLGCSPAVSRSLMH